MGYLAVLSETYKDHKIKIEPRDDHDLFVIVNPQGSENIEIEVYHDDSGDDLIFYFYRNHEHFHRNTDKLIAYINGFLNGEFVAYRFLRDDEEISRGFQEFDRMDTSSGESIMDSLTNGKSYWEQFGEWGLNTYEIVYKEYVGPSGHGRFMFSIYGWNGQHSKDIDFVL